MVPDRLKNKKGAESDLSHRPSPLCTSFFCSEVVQRERGRKKKGNPRFLSVKRKKEKTKQRKRTIFGFFSPRGLGALDKSHDRPFSSLPLPLLSLSLHHGQEGSAARSRRKQKEDSIAHVARGCFDCESLFWNIGRRQIFITADLFSHPFLFCPPPPLHHQHQTQAAFLYARFLRPSAPKALGRHLLGFSTAGAVSSLSLLALRRHAEPVFDPSSGALLDGGGDLRETGGMTSTMHDAIYVSALALLLGSRYDAALLLLFLPVLYALFKFWSSVLAPWVFTPTAREAREEAGGGSSSSGKRGRGVMPRSGGGGGGGGARRGEGRRA